MKKLPLTIRSLRNEDNLKESAARLRTLVDASKLDLSDEIAWELLADQCEESGEPEGVTRLALATAWRVVVQRLDGLCSNCRRLVQHMGSLKQANSSERILLRLNELQASMAAIKKGGSQRRPADILVTCAAEVTLERVRKLHDRLLARGLMREK